METVEAEHDEEKWRKELERIKLMIVADGDYSHYDRKQELMVESEDDIRDRLANLKHDLRQPNEDAEAEIERLEQSLQLADEKQPEVL